MPPLFILEVRRRLCQTAFRPYHRLLPLPFRTEFFCLTLTLPVIVWRSSKRGATPTETGITAILQCNGKRTELSERCCTSRTVGDESFPRSLGTLS